MRERTIRFHPASTLLTAAAMILAVLVLLVLLFGVLVTRAS